MLDNMTNIFWLSNKQINRLVKLWDMFLVYNSPKDMRACSNSISDISNNPIIYFCTFFLIFFFFMEIIHQTSWLHTLNLTLDSVWRLLWLLFKCNLYHLVSDEKHTTFVVDVLRHDKAVTLDIAAEFRRWHLVSL